MGARPDLSGHAFATRLLGVLLDGVERHRDGSWPLWLRLIYQMRRWGTKWWDPTVSVEVFGGRLLMPFSHDLPLYLRRHPQYGQPLVRLMQTLTLNGYVMDIGANIGDTAFLIRMLGDCPLVCVEGDQVFLKYLQVNTERLSDVRIGPFFVDSGMSFNTVVRSAGTARLGTKSWLNRDPIPTRSLEEIHSEYSEGERCALVKIDTDGLDLLILRQSLAWLGRERPVLFLEYAPAWLRQYSTTAASELLLSLRGAGYGHVAAFTNLGVPFGSYELDSPGIAALSNDFAGSATAYLDLALLPSGQPGEGPSRLVAELAPRSVG